MPVQGGAPGGPEGDVVVVASGCALLIAGAHGDDEGVVGRGRLDRVELGVQAVVARRGHDHNAVEPEDLRRRVQGADVVGHLLGGVDGEVHHPNVVGLLVFQHPLQGLHRVRFVGHAVLIADLQADEGDTGRHSHVGPIGVRAVASDDTGHVGAMAVDIVHRGGVGVEGLANRVDGEVAVPGDAAVDDRHPDACAVDAFGPQIPHAQGVQEGVDRLPVAGTGLLLLEAAALHRGVQADPTHRRLVGQILDAGGGDLGHHRLDDGEILEDDAAGGLDPGPGLLHVPGLHDDPHRLLRRLAGQDKQLRRRGRSRAQGDVENRRPGGQHGQDEDRGQQAREPTGSTDRSAGRGKIGRGTGGGVRCHGHGLLLCPK